MIPEVQNMIDVFSRFQSNSDTVLLDLVRAKKNFVLGLNTSQMNAGKKASGESLVPGYAESTIEYKRRKNQPFDRVTLEDEGDFYDSLIIEYGQDSFLIGSDDTKAVYLERKYGLDIYGLTEENIGLLSDELIDELINELRSDL